ncbi:hypothetical protein DFH09DRAFT_1072361 [Mycena vulgaris]|nr:hypothetical protein DFH09DRAFT_1072361 [Mycena vulgaris]
MLANAVLLEVFSPSSCGQGIFQSPLWHKQYYVAARRLSADTAQLCIWDLLRHIKQPMRAPIETPVAELATYARYGRPAGGYPFNRAAVPATYASAWIAAAARSN